MENAVSKTQKAPKPTKRMVTYRFQHHDAGTPKETMQVEEFHLVGYLRQLANDIESGVPLGVSLRVEATRNRTIEFEVTK